VAWRLVFLFLADSLQISNGGALPLFERYESATIGQTFTEHKVE
jgi:hypothetical protein